MRRLVNIYYSIWHVAADSPSGTWRKNDVVPTSVRRDDIVATSIRHHFGTICPLGSFCSPDVPGSFHDKPVHTYIYDEIIMYGEDI